MKFRISSFELRMPIVRQGALLVAGSLLLGSVAPVHPQAPTKSGPRLEALAETRLLMDGLNRANFQGLERLLRQEPTSDEAWTFARGQALLIAETGNLLLLRPPRNQGEAAWQERAAELRGSAARLARSAANRDYARSRAGLVELADVCNRCHQTFRVPTRLTPFVEPAERKSE